VSYQFRRASRTVLQEITNCIVLFFMWYDAPNCGVAATTDIQRHDHVPNICTPCDTKRMLIALAAAIKAGSRGACSPLKEADNRRRAASATERCVVSEVRNAAAVMGLTTGARLKQVDTLASIKPSTL